jgi:hypothetical protein
MYIISCSWGWSGPYAMVEDPGQSDMGAGTKPDMHTWWLLPSMEWSCTGPAQCVAYTLGQQLLIEGWPLGA